MGKKLIDAITSLKLTVICLVIAMILVFVGTLAQVELGLYETQKVYFRSLFIYWGPEGSDFKIPVLPGGYLLGTVLLVNLIGAHIKRFKFTKKKSGIFLTHLGLIVLLLGQFFTEVFQVESFMRIHEGQVKNYTEADRLSELVIIDTTDAEKDKVVAIPERMLKEGATFEEQMPFKVEIKAWFPNSLPGIGAPKDTGPDVITASHGMGRNGYFRKEPVGRSMDSRNIPAAKLAVTDASGQTSTWIVSAWLSDETLVGHVADQFGDRWLNLVEADQRLPVGNQTYKFALRQKRYYKNYSIELEDFRHDLYKGTDIPKNFSSRVHIQNAKTNEKRESLIYMNHPLRYEGETYFQASFDPNDPHVTVLQVVRNPSWLAPYLSCILVGIGLTVQFGIHLFSFIKKRRQA